MGGWWCKHGVRRWEEGGARAEVKVGSVRYSTGDESGRWEVGGKWREDGR